MYSYQFSEYYAHLMLGHQILIFWISFYDFLIWCGIYMNLFVYLLFCQLFGHFPMNFSFEFKWNLNFESIIPKHSHFNAEKSQSLSKSFPKPLLLFEKSLGVSRLFSAASEFSKGFFVGWIPARETFRTLFTWARKKQSFRALLESDNINMYIFDSIQIKMGANLLSCCCLHVAIEH